MFIQELKDYFMKLRLRENTIRLRLLQSEISKLAEFGEVTEKITFGLTQTLSYRVKVSAQHLEISAEFSHSEISILLPPEIAKNWIETNLVGVEKEQKIDEFLTLQILVEKDFVCVDRPLDIDNLDAFPHPKMKC